MRKRSALTGCTTQDQASIVSVRSRTPPPPALRPRASTERTTGVSSAAMTSGDGPPGEAHCSTTMPSRPTSAAASHPGRRRAASSSVVLNILQPPNPAEPALEHPDLPLCDASLGREPLAQLANPDHRLVIVRVAREHRLVDLERALRHPLREVDFGERRRRKCAPREFVVG